MSSSKHILPFQLAILLLAIVSVSIGCGRTAQHPPESDHQIWRFAIEESEGSVQHVYATQFKRQIEAATSGGVEVVVYPYGTLGTSTQITEQLNLGALEFAMASPGSIGKFIPETQVFLLHFVLSNSDIVNQQILSSPEVLETFDTLYRDKGLKLLSIFPEGEMVWTTQKEVRSPKDFQGVKIRVMTSPMLIDAYAAYGASPTPLPYAEVYSALQLGMVDAQVNPIFAIERQKFFEVTEWLIFPGHAHFVTTVVANQEFYDNLSEEDQAIVDQTIADLNDYIFEQQVQFQSDRLKAIVREMQQKRAKLNICGDLSDFIESLSTQERQELIDDNPFLNITPALTPAERERFQQASKEARKTFLQIGGPKADEILSLIRQVKNRVLDNAAQVEPQSESRLPGPE
ncbi:TRAP transporter substrate-binding protein DctP [Bythopirellula goksoeyrii]|uniref:2,3-diketo-L-gulonate-binding periplasmic protein YiaO n=1 Tax=Bythopirellula goksoeyrii TaxID=1400387 RepID=A0A5B9QHK3_9BACT|nr:TRAP transporter substrate-binding protein DctP [Bythopirellula goksoeyrii]QEG37419.1 2,3-diketo-L-gulonate-binding periplasmic protein YiaO precursor [Bythopirellula goksoeyrii]